MTTTTMQAWDAADFCFAAPVGAEDRLPDLAATVYERVCRTRFDAPGFCLVDLGPTATSRTLRRLMIDLKGRLQALHRARDGRDLSFLSVGRFDQQVTTRLHRDGGPDECFLMLGYEPSPVESDIAMADYSRCARDMGLSPGEFLDRHNPMFAAGEELLRPYTTRIGCFSNRNFQILFINNSIAAHVPEEGSWQGVLHTATIVERSETARRVVNSAMVGSVPIGTPEQIAADKLEEFASTSAVSRRGYDRPQVEDDG